jgi:hypothetical protein
VIETVRDRELQWQPVLNIVAWNLASSSGPSLRTIGGTVTIENVGSGPALGCRYLYRQSDRVWCKSNPTDIPAIDKRTAQAINQPNLPTGGLFEPETLADNVNSNAFL